MYVSVPVFVSISGGILSCVRKTTEQPALPTRSPVAQRYVQHRHPSSPTLKWASQSLSPKMNCTWVTGAIGQILWAVSTFWILLFKHYMRAFPASLHSGLVNVKLCPTQSSHCVPLCPVCPAEKMIYTNRKQNLFCSCFCCYLLWYSLINQIKWNSCWGL